MIYKTSKFKSMLILSAVIFSSNFLPNAFAGVVRNILTARNVLRRSVSSSVPESFKLAWADAKRRGDLQRSIETPFGSFSQLQGRELMGQRVLLKDRARDLLSVPNCYRQNREFYESFAVLGAEDFPSTQTARAEVVEDLVLGAAKAVALTLKACHAFENFAVSLVPTPVLQALPTSVKKSVRIAFWTPKPLLIWLYCTFFGAAVEQKLEEIKN